MKLSLMLHKKDVNLNKIDVKHIILISDGAIILNSYLYMVLTTTCSNYMLVVKNIITILGEYLIPIF